MKLLHNIFATLTVLLLVLRVSGQEKAVVIDGTRYYIHTVEKGHTLYAISKKYSVDIEYIVKENPFAQNGVKVGDGCASRSIRSIRSWPRTRHLPSKANT